MKFRRVLLLDEPVLLVDDGEVRQHLDCLAPAAVNRLVLRARHGVKLRQPTRGSHGLQDRERKSLGYGVMVTLQILVLSFLVRIQVAQQNTSFLLTKTR